MSSETAIPSGTDLLKQRIDALAGSLTPAARKVANFIDRHRVRALASSAADLAAAIGTSDATVIRAVQALGFVGLSELRQALAASLERPSSTAADDLRRTLAETKEGAVQAMDHVLEAHREAIDLLAANPARARIGEGVAALHPADRIVTFGIGPSAALARYAALLLTRIGRAARALDATGNALADQLLDLQQGDALLALAYGRAYREVQVVFHEAHRLGLPIVLVTDNLEARLARSATLVIPAQRGRAGRIALHGGTLVVLEMLVLGLAASDQLRAVASLDRLTALRSALVGVED